jgi:TolB-like protein/predicted Zn-dependent protease
MTPARFQTIEQIYREALEQQPDQLGAFLDKACEGDAVLRHKVEALLSSRQRADGFIEDDSAVGLAARIIQNGEAEALVGRTIGHYKISESIGSVGMGEVYLATDIVAGRKAAVKLLPLRFTGDGERLKRFEREARAVVGLNHPNIVTVYEIGQENSIHYIASELIEGETLRDRLARGPVPLSEALDVAIQVASALAAAQQAGIVHRDIKPENIMLRPDGYAKVLDFGIAKLAEQELPTSMPKDEALLLVETNLGSVLGTVRYMSPEQARGGHVDKQTDIWSLGVVLYEMVSGHAPFSGNTPKEVMSSILEKEPRQLAHYVARAPAELQQIVAKALRKDPAQRYRSAHELLEALKNLRRKLEFESFTGSGFFDEVKRRKVYRVAVAYIIAAAGIIQLASAVIPAWDLPNWTLRLVVVLLLIGFPLALILGWIFDITSRGIRVTPGTHRRLNAIMLVAAGAIISGAAGFLLLPRVSAYKVDKSIAVLPFENLSKDEENAFFAGGVQDEILTDLAKVADLKVISRTSVMKYKSGLERNLREIANTLGVSHVVEGSVQRAAGRVRVNVQLIDARNDAHIWAEHYDRDFSDIFAIQSEIAEQIADQLRAKLSPSEKAAIAERPTADLVAYAYYTRAKEMNPDEDWQGAEKPAAQRVELLEKATQRDPNFVLAYCELAKAQIDLVHFSSEAEQSKSLESAKKAAQTAVRLRPDLPEPHLALALCYWYAGSLVPPSEAVSYYGRAGDELTIVRQKLPNNAEALMIGAMIGRHQNRWDASLADLRKANELDPRNTDIAYYLWQTCFEMRRYSEAEKLVLKRAANGKKQDLPAKRHLAEIKLAHGDPVGAQRLLEQIPLEFNAGPWIWGTRFKAALYLRDYDAASKVIAVTLQNSASRADVFDGNSEWVYGLIARARGDKQRALAAFQAGRNLEALNGDKPEDAPHLATLASYDAGLGRKEEAIREARRAVEIMPIAVDSLNGPHNIANLALVYAWTGERDAALEQLESIATVPGFGPDPGLDATYGDLLLNPCWDDLRGAPRFDKIVAAAKAAMK